MLVSDLDAETLHGDIFTVFSLRARTGFTWLVFAICHGKFFCKNVLLSQPRMCIVHRRLAPCWTRRGLLVSLQGL
jgi:hypothetical protein